VMGTGTAAKNNLLESVLTCDNVRFWKAFL
jgi:hypothetical protein